MNMIAKHYALDIKGEEDFAARVEAASAQRVIVVDFWAEWCAPCKVLGPVLDKVVRSYAGKAVLAKVNVDENQQLAGEFGIRSIPTLLVFKKGIVADQMVGAISKDDLKAKLEPHL